MKIYKYRAMPPGDKLAFERFERIVRQRLLWCARPDTLNDPVEFAWTCDFKESPLTIDLIAELLEEANGLSPSIAREIALDVIRRGRVGELCAPVIDNMIQRQRNEIGIACFGIVMVNSFSKQLDQRLAQVALTTEQRRLVDEQRVRLAGADLDANTDDATKTKLRLAINESFVHGFRRVTATGVALALASALSAFMMIEGRMAANSGRAGS